MWFFNNKVVYNNIIIIYIFSFLQIALRSGVHSKDVKNVIIWGNHSATQFPDVSQAKVKKGGAELSAYESVKDDAWLKGDFITVRFIYCVNCACC